MAHNHGDARGAPSPEVLFGQELRRLRVARGWSQDEVARRMAAYGYDSWHQTTVGRIETAQRPLRLNEAVALTNLFEVPLSDWMLRLQLTVEELDTEIRQSEAQRAALVQEADQAEEARSTAQAVYEAATAVHDKRARALASLDAHLSSLRSLRKGLYEPGTGETEPPGEASGT